MKTLLCCIGKNENRNIIEFVEHYKNIGFTNICLFDNNDEDGENFGSKIQEHIDSGFVILKNYRGRKVCQMDAYNECYTEFGDRYDWIAFFDCDEYLTLVKNNTIEQYLKRIVFKNADLIHINWMIYGDNGNVKYDSRRLSERFPKPIKYDAKIAYDFPENYHVKSIVRGGRDSFMWTGGADCHTPSLNGEVVCVNASGQKVISASPFCVYNYSDAYLKHYSTKTAEEYAEKMKKGFPDQLWDGSRIANLIETRFFRTNEITAEKIAVFKDKLDVDVSYLLGGANTNINAKIYSLCYSKKKFDFLNDNVITPLQVGAALNHDDVCNLKDNTGDNISSKNYFFIEGTGTYWIWKNVHDCKYKGQMQYRRPLAGVNEKMDFDGIFKNYDAITCKPYNYPTDGKPTAENNYMTIPSETVEGGYAFSNCIIDLKIVESIIKSKHPEYSEDYDKYIVNGADLYYSNGFILREKDYDEYAEFLFSILNEYLKITGISSKEELYYHVGVNFGAGYYPRYKKGSRLPMEAVRWQSEIGGFLSERIWTLWVLHKFGRSRIYELPYVKQEEGMYT